MQLLEFPLTDWTLDRVLRWRAEHTPDRAFISFEGGTYQTYRETFSVVSDFARGIADLGVCAGDRVAIFARNSLHAVHAWFASNLLGATDAPINPAFRGQPLVHALNMIGAKVVLVEEDLLPALSAIESQLKSLVHVLQFDGRPPPSRMFQRLSLQPLPVVVGRAPACRPQPITFDQISSILMTSGTSGPSKGVMVPHAQGLLTARHTVEGLGVTEDDTFYCAHPVFHMSPRYCVITAAMLAGAKVWLDGGFSASRWLDRIRLAGATVTIGHGPLLEMIFAQPERPDDADNPLKRIGTSPFPKHIAHAFEARFDVKGIETWGMTEVGIPVWHPLEAPLRPGYAGKVRDDWFEVKVVDPETDLELPTGEVGELVVRSKYPSTLMQGYLGRPDATQEAWRNLWFHSGDAGLIDADGWVIYVDRIKDRIRRRAENISSYDIEYAAAAFEGVAEAAAVGVPSEFAGDDDVKLVIVAEPNVTVAPGRLIEHLARLLPHHMVPRYIETITALPRTPTQKVQKVELRKAGVTEKTWDRKATGIALRDIVQR